MPAAPPQSAAAQQAAAQQADRLLDWFRSLEPCVVAFSGGVDSAVVAQAAWLALGDRALAVTGVSPSLAASELEAARELARRIGIPHREVATQEFRLDEYLRNSPDRCYHCKTELYGHLDRLLDEGPWRVIVNGANLDDQGDYRPGMQAAREHQVRSPLAECGFSKQDVRQLAAHWGLPVWDKPASPCLSSRVAYGEAVTPERLALIDRAEGMLRELGFREVRVRYHRGDLARIEVPLSEVSRFADPGLRDRVAEVFTGWGFKFVTLDLQGFRSGSLNQLIHLEPPSA